MSKRCKALNFILICLLFVLVSISVPYSTILMLDNNIFLTQAEFDMLLHNNPELVNNNLISVVNDLNDDQINQYVINYKLFNLFNIKNVKVNVTNNNTVFVGGNCVGLSLQNRGIVVVGSNNIITKNGHINPAEKAGIKVGDKIISINNIEINNINDVNNVLLNCNAETELNIEYVRNGEIFTTTITPQLDVQTKTYKLGIWIKDDTMGVGTLTYINPNNLRFGALGHAIVDTEFGDKLDIKSGQLYKCNVVGIKSGQMGVPGEILGLFVPGRNQQGTVDKNNEYGVFGLMFEDSELLKNKQKMQVGGRASAKPGKAKILTTIDGTTIESFDVEIIKTNYQNGSNAKSMVIRVTDKDLIARTGGIVQGMSGSPIIQDGKIIGAVTHVFVNDPQKGFGLYIDWMINE